MTAILGCSRALFEQLAGPRDWRIEVHQFRIAARRAKKDVPTPEGIHRDGVDYVLVLLIDRQNIASGDTTVHRLDGEELGAFTLTDAARRGAAGRLEGRPRRDAHRAGGSAHPAYRDVLVVTWRRPG